MRVIAFIPTFRTTRILSHSERLVNPMYREILLKYQKDNPWINIAPPAPIGRVMSTAKDLGADFPEEERQLLLELDGDGVFLLNLNLLVRANRLARSNYEPPDAKNILIIAKSDFPKKYYGYIAADKQSDNSVVCYRPGIYVLTPERSPEPVAKDIGTLIDLYYQGLV